MSEEFCLIDHRSASTSSHQCTSTSQQNIHFQSSIKQQQRGKSLAPQFFQVPGRQHGLLTKFTTVFSWDKSKRVFPPHNPNCGKTQIGFCSWERFWHCWSGFAASIQHKQHASMIPENAETLIFKLKTLLKRLLPTTGQASNDTYLIHHPLLY